MRSFFFIFAISAIANGLDFVPDRPGLIPDLTKLESSRPFVWRQVDLSDQRKVRDLEHLVSLSLNDMQKANLDGAPYVNLVKIEQAIEEVVTGNNYAVVFSAKRGYVSWLL
uniref:Uncharacterized protein n=1 Tax=Romanomermis culicivorax TaxID=13658 RepID=A0A915KW58_ROMCU